MDLDGGAGDLARDHLSPGSGRWLSIPPHSCSKPFFVRLRAHRAFVRHPTQMISHRRHVGHPTHQRLAMFMANQNVRDLEQLTELIESGALKPALDRTFMLDQLPEAMRHLQAGDARGKIAITI